jgi:general secretion pathway protein M
MKLPISLNKRERIAVFSALLVIGALIVLELGLLPVIRYRKTLNQSIDARMHDFEEIQELRKTHIQLKHHAEAIRSRLAQREKGFTLFSFLDRSAANVGIKDRIAYIKPSGSDIKHSDFKVFQVELKLQSISLHQLSAFLLSVEADDSLVKIKKASIVKSGQSGEGIDAILWVETIAA